MIRGKTVQEIWKDISGYEGLYQVSDFGRVRSLGRVQHIESAVKGSHKRVKPVRILKGIPDKDGYLQVNLFDADGIRHTRKIHRLVILQFLGPPEDPSLIPDHKNGVRDDNRLSNLRWLTCSQNNRNRHKSNAASGIFGVRYRPTRRNPWQAYCHEKGRFRSLGHFPTKEMAAQARKAFEGHVL
nr:NUMOD4 motif-containing HNH endonuclease [Agrobacterium tumefaciens]